MGRKPTSNKANRSETAPSQLRVIGGQWRGRKLDFKAAEGLRPTPDRVRETLFNWLQPYIPGAKCLDLFSGTGALGIEALSRGADHTTFVELNRSSAQQLSNNLNVLKTHQAEVIQADVLDWLKQLTAPSNQYDVVFMDPPFRKDLVAECCSWLEEQQLLSEQAVIYIETESELVHIPLPSHWREHRQKQAGQVCYRLFIREPQ